MKLKAQNSSQKLRGGYYTPRELTDFIIRWAFQDGPKKNILEPSCGDGAFLEGLTEIEDVEFDQCTAIEIIEEEAEKAKQKVLKGNHHINIINNDFFSEFTDNLQFNEYDLIIGNPPYIRYQYLTPEQRDTQSDILVRNGMKSNKLINAWVSFVVASVQLLSSNGKIGLIIPAELLQVAYAADLRQFLENTLSKITVITFKELVFPDVQQEVVLLLGEKGDDINLENKISLIDVTNLQSLNEEIMGQPVEYKEVDHSKDKWTKYFLSNHEIEAINSVISDSRFNKFEEIADVDIGITTGNNKYFSVKKEVVQEYGLEEVIIPLIGRSAHAKGIYFNHEDWLANVNANLPAQLVYFPNESSDNFSEGHKEYIKWGEEVGHNNGYKLGLRKYWYHIPSVWQPDAFILRRNDLYPKFVINKINAVSTDTMHRVRFNEGLNHQKILLSYYNSITLAFTEIEGRSYGGGVLEILPGEVEKIMLPNLQNIDDNLAKKLLEHIDDCIRNNTDFEQVLDLVDREVLVKYLALEEEFVSSFRVIWKKLMKRRRERK
ncbi:class I SAM-dependent methyltransferase [uncultured Metabacillus sp.]|uniref:class I SAM-dependent methyltransferase n=1 Tax=uncultured Metabacillus sp. TaxID=2860135 RepID=UPI00263063DE|nr:class I SAM-dependent methyltransferase [uncultured Metabacillus sp.]